MITTQTADNVLKSYYLPVVTEQLDKSANPFLAQIKKTTSDVWGKDVRKAVRFGVNGGIGAGTEEGNLPKPEGNKYAQFVTTLKNLYGNITISDKAIRAAAKGEGAFVDLLNDEMDGLVKSSSYNFGRMLFGDGSGKLATFINLSTSGQNGFYNVDTVRNLAEGMVVDLYNDKDVLVNAGCTIVGIDRSKRTVKISGGSVNPAPSYYLTVQGSKDLEITGLGAIFKKTGTLYGLDRAENTWLQPLIKEGIEEITENDLQIAIDEVEERSGSKINMILCSWGVRRALIDAISKYRTVDSIELAGGYRTVSFNGIPIVADRFCPSETMYLLNTDDFALHQLCDWQWLEGDNGKVLTQIPGTTTYTATLVKYAELMCYRPAGQAMLTDVAEM